MLLKHVSVAAVLAAAIAAGPAQAGPMAVDFIINSTDTSDFFMTDEANGVMRLASSTIAITSEDPDSPFVGATGDCFGSARMVMGLVSGEGFCAYTDVAGDQVQIHWTMMSTGTQTGMWEVAGGTGRWAAATGGGVFTDSAMGDGTSNTHITGSITFN